MSTEVRFCAHCDQPVDEIADSKLITSKGEDTGKYKHKAPSHQGVGNCGRQFLREDETYTES